MNIIIIAIIFISALIISWIAFRKSMENKKELYLKIEGLYVILSKDSIEFTNDNGYAVVSYKNKQGKTKLIFTRRDPFELYRYKNRAEKNEARALEMYKKFLRKNNHYLILETIKEGLEIRKSLVIK